MFNRVSRKILERLGVPEERTYTVKLGDGRRIPRTRGRTRIRLQGQEFPAPVTLGEPGLLGDLTLGDAMLSVDPHARRLVPVDGWLMTEGCGIPG